MSGSARRAVVPQGVAAAAAKWKYSPGLVAGDLVFVAGQVGRDASGRIPEDPEEQFVTAFENVGAVLSGASAGFEHVVDLTTFHTTFDAFEVFAEVKERYFSKEPYPAWTAIGDVALALPGLIVEVKVIARL